MSLTLRPARSTDAGKLGTILSEAIAAQSWMPQLHTGAEDIAHMGDLIDRGWITVCESGGALTGFIALDGPRIQSLYVLGSAQNAGIGRALLDWAKTDRARLELWTFQANEAAQRFYLANGFEEAQRTDGAGNEEGLPDVRYIWTRADKETSHG